MPQADDEPIMHPALRRKVDQAVFHPRKRGPATSPSPQMILIRAMHGEMCPSATERVASVLANRIGGETIDSLNAKAAFEILGMV